MSVLSSASNDDIINKTLRLVEDSFGKNKASLESNFQHDLNADSLDMVEFSMKVETEFEIEIPDNDASQIETVQDIVNYIIKRRDELSSRKKDDFVA